MIELVMVGASREAERDLSPRGVCGLQDSAFSEWSGIGCVSSLGVPNTTADLWGAGL